MVHHRRFKGRLLPRPNLQGPLEVPPFRLPGTGLRISGSPFRSFPITQSLYTGRGGRLGATARKRPEDITVLRRLADLWVHPSAGHEEHRGGTSPHSGPGLQGEFEEERPKPTSGGVFSWDPPGLPCNGGTPHTEEGCQDPGDPPIFSPGQEIGVPLLPEASGVDFSCNHACSTGPSQSSPSPAVAEFVQASPKERQAQKTQSDTIMLKGPASMARHEATCTWSFPGLHSVQTNTGVNGCLPVRLGSSLGGQDRERSLATSLGHGTHKCAGTPSSVLQSQSLVARHSGQTRPCPDRQCHGCLLHQSSGGDEVSPLPQDGAEATLLVIPTLGVTEGHLRSRGPEQGSGPSLQVRTLPRRMEAASGGGSQFVGTLWDGQDRPLCIEGDHSLPKLVLYESSQGSTRTGCTIPRMAGRAAVCLPPIASDSPCLEQGGSGMLHSAVNRTSVASAALVSSSSTTCSGHAIASTSQGRSPISGRGPDMAPQANCAAAVGLAAEESLPQELDQAVLETLNNARAPSTRAIYRQRWRAFCSWCLDREIEPTMCPVPVILQFLQSLLEAGRTASTLRGYAAAISCFHDPVGGLSVGKQPVISQFLRGAKRLRPGRCLRAPSWDLPLVLRSLTRGPYEPLEHSSLKLLTHKTAFLIAMCSAKRVGELHALSISPECMRWKPEQAGVTLWPNPYFLPKVLTSQSVNSAIELQAFHPEQSCHMGMDLTTLCPVRVLREYINRTQRLRQAHTQLFVCYGEKLLGLPVSKQRLSHWLVDTISQAYSEQGFPVPEGLVAHSTRGMATSWAALKGVSLSDICAAASWSSPCTFARFYRINVVTDSVGSTVLRAAVARTGEEDSSVPRDTFDTGHPQ